MDLNDQHSISATTCCTPAIRMTVLGIGNILLGDDGAGIVVAESLRDELDAWGIDVVDGGTLSHSLLPIIEDCEGLVAIDAAQLHARPGTVKVFDGVAMDEYLLKRRSGTVHEVGLADLLDMARLRDALPGQRALVAVQPGRIGWGSELSPDVGRAIPAAAGEVRRLLEAWL